ncbi:MAG: carboxypeptidase regulatory-like domain-containing protein, partial [Thermoanaerobaculia bacterium]
AGLAFALPVQAGTVAGRVVDSKGNPVVAARVAWYAFRPPDRVLLDRTNATERAALGQTKTDANGSFKVTFDKPTEGISLEISASGLPSVDLDGPYDAGEDSLDLDILLPETDRVAGRISDEAGQPLAGARIRAAPDPNAAEAEAVPFAQTVSQADGRFVLDSAPKGAVLRIDLRGFAVLRLYASRSGSALFGTLKRGGGLEGKVLDPAGQAVAGAIVVAGQIAAQTDAQGTYRIAALPAAPVSLVVNAKNDLVARRDGVSIRRGETTRADLKLSQTAVIAGSVVDVRSGKPVAGATLRYSEAIGPWAIPSGRSVRADGQGRFRIAGLLAREYQVTAQRRDYVAATIPGVAAVIARPNTLRFALRRSYAIPGRVLDEKGGAVAGARISVLPALMGRRSFLQGVPASQPTTVTAADGSFRLRGVAPDPAVSIEARKEAYVTLRRHGLSTAEADAKPVTLTLRRGLDARGSVVDAQDQPVSGAQLRLQRRQKAERQGQFSAPGADSAPPAAISDSQGRLQAIGLEAGEYSARLTREGYAGKTIPLLDVRADGATVWPPFKLEPAAPIAGFVRNRKGEPVAGAQVYSFAGEAPSTSSMTDSTGAFRLDGYPAGTSVNVSVSAEGYARAQVPATAPAASLAVVLSTNAEVRGRVEDFDTREPIELFSVRAGTPRSSNMRYLFSSDFRSPDGSFVLATVPPGKVEVSASAPGYLETAVTALEIGEGESREGVVLSLKRGREINGRVLEPARGTGLPNATVSWRREHEMSSAGLVSTSSGTFMTIPNSTTTDADGRFHFDGLPPERLVLSAAHLDYLDASMTADAATQPSVELTLSLGGAVAGTVVERDGRMPVPGAEVSIEALGESGASLRNDAARSDASGRFRFEHLKEGRFRVNARADSGRTPVHDVVLAQDQRLEDVLLQLARGARVRGRVTGLPAERLGGVTISVASQDFQNRTSTSDDGAFVVDDVPAGPLRVSASTGSPGRMVARSAEVPEGASEISVNIVFEAGSRLSGRVTKADRGVPGLFVSATADPPSASAPRAAGRTD